MKKYLKYIFASLSVGLTIISMDNGFYFYLNMFEIRTAILATVVFEILRLATLYSFIVWDVRKRVIAGTLYVIVAFICAFSATSSFHAKIIESQMVDTSNYRNEIDKRLNIVMKEYALQMQDKLTIADKDITYAQRKVAALPKSTYWPKREAQLKTKKKLLIAERDSVLASVPTKNLEDWVEQKAAILGLSLGPMPINTYGSNAILQAIQEMWVVEDLTVKKIVALLITLGIEVGIVLLAIFAKIYSRVPEEEEVIQEAVYEDTGSYRALGMGQSSNNDAYTWPSERKNDKKDDYTWPSERKNEPEPPGSSSDNNSGSYAWSGGSGNDDSDGYTWPSERSGRGSSDSSENADDGEASEEELSSPVESESEMASFADQITETDNEEYAAESEENSAENEGYATEDTAASDFEYKNPPTIRRLDEAQEEALANTNGHMDSGEAGEEESILDTLYNEFGENNVNRFLEKAQPFFMENGKMPTASNLSKSMRPIRRFMLKRYRNNKLDDFFRGHETVYNDQDS